MGYAGGTTSSPTYRDIGNHAEALRIAYDPERVGLDALLELFWSGHDPTYAKRSQYRAELYCEDDAECGAARASAAALAPSLDGPIRTVIAQNKPFFAAEDYHQKWYLRRHDDLWQELRSHYPTEAETIGSVAAARLNAYVGGHGSPADLERDIDRFGLSEAGRVQLRKAASRR